MKKRINFELQVLYEDNVIASLVSLQRGLDIPSFFSADGYQGSLFEYTAKVTDYESDLLSGDTHHLFSMSNEEYLEIVDKNPKLASVILLFNIVESVGMGRYYPTMASLSKVGKQLGDYKDELTLEFENGLENLVICLLDNDIKLGSSVATYTITVDLSTRVLNYKGFYHHINNPADVEQLMDGELKIENYVKYCFPHDVLKLDDNIDEYNIERIYKNFNTKQIEALKDTVDYLTKKPDIKEVERFCDYELGNDVNIISNNYSYFTAMMPLNYMTYFSESEFQKYHNPFLSRKTVILEDYKEEKIEASIDEWPSLYPSIKLETEDLIRDKAFFDAKVFNNEISILCMDNNISYMSRITIASNKPKHIICTCDCFNKHSCCSHTYGLWYLYRNNELGLYGASVKNGLFVKIKNIFKRNK